jgi:hypothetical protein
MKTKQLQKVVEGRGEALDGFCVVDIDIARAKLDEDTKNAKR